MSIEISKSHFKAKALEIMREIEETGEEVIITSYGKKTLSIKKYSGENEDTIVKLKKAIVSYEDPFSPIDEDDWEMS